MSGKADYLEKYSVAPAPSRDYYGITVHRDEVILHLWRISHGPHRAPIIHHSNFAEFEDDKTLQDEIYRAFGERVLNHIRGITRGRGSNLFVLPKRIVRSISEYLGLEDILNLRLVSYIACEIFNDNLIWKSLYKRYVNSKLRKYETDYGMSYGWKQLFKEQRLQTSTKEPNSGTRGVVLSEQQLATSSREEKAGGPRSTATVAQKKSFKPASKSTTSPNPFSTSDAFANEPVARLRRKSGVNSEARPKSGTKSGSESVVKKSWNDRFTTARTDEKSKFMVKPSRATETNSRKQTTTVSNKVSPTGSKVLPSSNSKPGSGTSKVTQLKKTTSGTSTSAIGTKPSPGKNESSNHPRGVPARSKQIVRPKESGQKVLGQSKSTILRTGQEFVDELSNKSTIGPSYFDLAQLLASTESARKNPRDPKSVFDYDFSCLRRFDVCAGDAAKMKDDEARRHLDTPRGRSSTRTNVALDRLSEKSEPIDATSAESIAENNTVLEMPCVGTRYETARRDALKKFTEYRDACKDEDNVLVDRIVRREVGGADLSQASSRTKKFVEYRGTRKDKDEEIAERIVRREIGGVDLIQVSSRSKKFAETRVEYSRNVHVPGNDEVQTKSLGSLDPSENEVPTRSVGSFDPYENEALEAGSGSGSLSPYQSIEEEVFRKAEWDEKKKKEVPIVNSIRRARPRVEATRMFPGFSEFYEEQVAEKIEDLTNVELSSSTGSRYAKARLEALKKYPELMGEPDVAEERIGKYDDIYKRFIGTKALEEVDAVTGLLGPSEKSRARGASLIKELSMSTERGAGPKKIVGQALGRRSSSNKIVQEAGRQRGFAPSSSKHPTNMASNL